MNDTPIFNFPLTYSAVISKVAEFLALGTEDLIISNESTITKAIDCANSIYNGVEFSSPEHESSFLIEESAVVWLSIKPYIKIIRDKVSKAKFPIFHFPLKYDEVISDFAKFEGIKDPVVKHNKIPKLEEEIRDTNLFYSLRTNYTADPNILANTVEEACAALYEGIKPYIVECDEASKEPEFYNPNINNILKDINTLIEKSAVSIEQACRIIELAQKDQEIEAMRRQTFAIERVSHKQF